MKKVALHSLSLAMLTLSLSSCSNLSAKNSEQVTNGKPAQSVSADEKQPKAKLEKIGYYLPKSMFDVSASLTFERKKVAFKSGENWKVKLCPKKQLVDKDVQYNHIVVADTEQRYEIDPNSSFFRELAYTIELTEDGRLVGINSTSSGKVGDFIQSMGSFVGRVLPFLAGGLSGARTHSFEKACKSNSTAQANARAWFDEVFEENTDNDKSFKTIRENINSLSGALDSARDHRIALLKAINDDINKQESAKKRLQQVGILEQAIEKLESQFARANALKDVQFTKFKKANDIRNHREIIASKKRFSLAQMMQINGDTFTSPLIESPIEIEECIKPLESLTKLWKCSGVAMRLSSEQTLTDAISPTSEQVQAQGSKNALAIVSRPLVPIKQERIEWVGTPDFDGNMSNFESKIMSISTLNVLAPNSTVTVHVLDKSAWKDNKLQLVYNDLGAVKKVVATTGGGADVMAKSLDEALKGGLTAYKETLTTYNTIKQQEAEISRASDKARLEQLKLEKELLDSEIALAGATATEAMVREKALLEKEFQLLEAGQKLASAYPELATDTARINAELSRLKAQAELDNLKKPVENSELDKITGQISLLQKQQLLTQLQAPMPSPTQEDLLRQQSVILQLQVTIAKMKKQLEELQ